MRQAVLRRQVSIDVVNGARSMTRETHSHFFVYSSPDHLSNLPAAPAVGPDILGARQSRGGHELISHGLDGPANSVFAEVLGL